MTGKGSARRAVAIVAGSVWLAGVPLAAAFGQEIGLDRQLGNKMVTPPNAPEVGEVVQDLGRVAQDVQAAIGRAVPAAFGAGDVWKADDDLEFPRAFAAARQQLGPDGVFAWRGEEYTTAYREEVTTP